VTLESRVPLLTPAGLQQEANELLGKQSAQLETFSTELAVNLGAAFDRAFDERLGEHIGPLTQAMQRLAESVGMRNEEAVQAMLDSFLSRLQGGASDRMEEVVTSLGRLGPQLEALHSSLGDAATRMAQSADAMATRMGEGAESALGHITDQISGLVENLGDMIEQTQTAGGQAGRDLSARIETAAKGLEQAAHSVRDVLATAAAGLEERIGEQAATSSARLAAQFDRVVGELRAVAENARVTGTETFVALAGSVGAASAGFESSATRVANALEQGAANAVQQVSMATENLSRQIASMTSAGDALVVRITELNRAAHYAATPLTATASDLKVAGQTIRGILEPLKLAAQSASRAADQIASAAQRFDGAQAAAARLVESLNAAAQRFEGVDRELANTLNELQAGLQGFTTRVGTFVGETDQNLAKAATQLGSLVKGLQDTLDDFAPTRPHPSGVQDTRVRGVEPLRAPGG
jgi:chromosome segregation ATPase